MKKLLLLFVVAAFALATKAQVSLTVNVETAGQLSQAITAAGGDANSITDLTVTGNIDARDFKFMRDSMDVLAILDLENSSIKEFYGNGTNPYSSNYPENTLPDYSFCNLLTWSGKITLSKVKLPNRLKNIGQSAFALCKGLVGNLIIPDSVININSGAFQYCTGFSGNLIIPNSVRTIGENAFNNCYGLTGNLTIGDSVASIGEGAFFNCSGFTGDLLLPSSLTSINNDVFNGCSGFNGKLTIPNSVIYIGENAFYNCFSFIGDLTIPNSVTTINKKAFYGNSGFNGRLTISNSLAIIEEETFFNCSGLTGDLTIPNSLTTIKKSAFGGCSGFNGNLIIPNSISFIGESAFSYCSGLTGDLIIPSSVTNISNRAFFECSGFNGKLTIPNSISFIGESAFSYCSGLTGDLIIPSSVTNISNRAFLGCSGFNGKLTIPNSINYISENTFANCSGFIGNLIIPEPIDSIAPYAFSGCNGFNGKLILPNSLTYIGYCAFYYCHNFTESLIIPNTVKYIGEAAFMGLFNMNNLTLSNSLTTIEKSAFQDCSFSGSLIIPNGIKIIKEDAFQNNRFNKILLPNTLDTIDTHGINIPFDTLLIPTSVKYLAEDAITNYNSVNNYYIETLNPVPIALSANSFSLYKYNLCKLKVPYGSINSYKSATYWSNFTNIVDTSYIVTFESNGGSAVLSTIIDGNRKIDIEPTTTKDGYTFQGWFKNQEYLAQWDFAFDTVTNPITLYAKWGKNLTVSFNTNGGNSINNIITVENSKISEPVDVINTGYTLEGWYKESTLDNKWDFINDSITTDCILYAKWTINQYTLSFETNGAGSINDTTVNYNSEVEIPTSLVKTGYIFEGWYNESVFYTRINTAQILMVSNLKLYAKWKIKTYSFLPNTQDGNYLGNHMVEYHSNLEEIFPYLNPAKEGYTFDGWYKERRCLNKWNPVNDFIISDTILYAKWLPNQYTLSFEPNGGSTIEDTLIQYNTLVDNIPEPIKANYSFEGWYIDETLLNRWDLRIKGNTTIYANWLSNYTFNLPIPGTLSTNIHLNGINPLNIKSITLLGEIDARDIKYLRDSLSNLQVIDLKDVTIIKYNGTEGTVNYSNYYPPNELPRNSFSDESLNGKSSLTKIKLPLNIISIGKYAFAKCPELTEVEFGNAIQNIDDNAFYMCYKLSGSLILPNSVKTIGNYCFYYCYNLKGNLVLGKSLTSIGYNAFYNCGFTGKLQLPETLKTISFLAFCYCSGFTGNLIIPDSVTSIEDNAFHGCYWLTDTIKIPSSVKSIGSTIFPSPTSINTIICNIKTPLSINSTTFDKIYQTNVKLYVPKGSRLLYKAAPYWTEFNKIIDSTFSISYNTGYETNIPHSWVKDTSVINAPVCNRQGYTLIGWFKNQDLTNPWDFNNDLISSDTILYAKWIKNFTVHFNSNGGNNVPDNSNAYNTTITAPNQPSKDGYTFAEWYSNSILQNVWNFSNDTVKFDTTLYAKWTINNYTVNFNTTGGSEVASQQVDFNTTTTVPSSPIRTFYNFLGWYKEPSCLNMWDFEKDTIKSDTILYAKWKGVDVNVSFNTKGGSTIKSILVEYNTLIPAVANPTKTGYTFDGWYKEYGCINPWDFKTDTITYAVTLYAKWKVNSYIVNFNSNGGNEVNSTTAYYMTLAKTPSSPTKHGYSFGGWYNDPTLENEWVFNTDLITGDTTLYAKWNPDYYFVNFNTNGGSTISSEIVAYNTILLNLPDPQKQGHTFIGWFKDIELGQIWDYSLDTIKSDTTLYAKWEINNYLVSFNTNGGSNINGLTLPYNSLAGKPEAPTRAQYIFGGWYKEANFVTKWDFTSDVVTADTMLFAKWIDNSLISSIDNNSGELQQKITDSGKDFHKIYKLVLTGNIDARDFKFMRDSMPALEVIDLLGATIQQYEGTEGTNPNGWTYSANRIPDYAFSNPYNYIGKYSLTSVTLPENITSIGQYAFNDCANLSDKLIIPDMVEYINQGAFKKCKNLTGDLILPNSVQSVDNYAFQDCSGLSGQLTLSNTLQKIGSSAFDGCSGLSGNIYIPASVTSIGNIDFGVSAFGSCNNINAIKVDANNDNYSDKDGVLYDKGQTILIQSPSGFQNNNYTIPATVTQIFDYAFNNCTGLNGSLTLSSSLSKMGDAAFYGCKNLTKVIVNQAVPISIPGNTFSGVDKTTCELVVPKGSKSAYQSASYWNEFKILSESYFVTFNSLGGDLNIDIPATENSTISEPGNPVKQGYTFAGWYKEPECINAWNFYSNVITNNTTLYAKWNINSYKVTFISNGGNNVYDVLVLHNSTFAEPFTGYRNGYTFDGWFKESEFINKWNFESDVVLSSINLYRKWITNKYKVYFYSNGDYIKIDTSEYNTTVKEPLKPTRAGYTFEGWYKEADFLNKWDFGLDIVSNHTVLYGKWAINSYIVSFNSNGGEPIGSKIVTYEELLTKPAAPKRQGYTFNGWYKETDLINLWDFENDRITDNTTLYAKWNKVDDIQNPETIELTLYPNPVFESLKVSYPGINSIIIYNLSGVEVLNETCKSLNEKVINTSNLKSGSYLLIIKTKNEATIKSTFIKR